MLVTVVTVGAPRYDGCVDVGAEAEAVGGTGLVEPQERECVCCYVARAVAEHGCDGTLRLARAHRDATAPGAVGLERRLTRIGVTCDCAVEERGWWLRREHWERDLDTDELRPPAPRPGCGWVPSGSSQPCGLWVRPRAWE